jgi:predicted metal-dependent phosphoesterase TrpH
MYNPIIPNKIIFEKPDAKKLSKEGYMCIDMHLHSRFSDGTAKIPMIMKKAKQNSFGVAVTDHNEIKGSQEAFKLCSTKSPVIPGIEVTCSNGRDFLLYFYKMDELSSFYKKYIKNYKRADPMSRTSIDMYDFLDVTSKVNCLVAAAHPFGIAYKNTYKIIRKDYSYSYLKKIDAMEILNGAFQRKHNMKAIVWNYNMNRGFIGGSDAHTLREVGGVLTCSRAETIEEFLDNIKKKQNFVIGKESGIRKKAMAYSSIFGKHMRYFHPKVLEKIRNNKFIHKIFRLEDDDVEDFCDIK